MDNKFELAIYNRLKSGEHVVAELKSTSDKRRRWVAIYQPKYKAIDEREVPHIFTILDFELDRDKIDQYFSDEEMVNKQRYYANTEKEVFEILKSMGIDPGEFTYPWRCDYPL